MSFASLANEKFTSWDGSKFLGKHGANSALGRDSTDPSEWNTDAEEEE